MSDPDDFPALLAGAAVVICGMGTTLYESAALGIPTIVVPSTDVHAQQARWLQQHGFLRCAEAGGGEAVTLSMALLDDQDTARAISVAGRRFAKPNTVSAIAAELVRSVSGSAAG